MSIRPIKITIPKKTMPTIPTSPTPMDIHEHFPKGADYQRHEIWHRGITSPLLNDDDSLPDDFVQFQVSGILHLACPRNKGYIVCHKKDGSYGANEDKRVKEFIMSFTNPSQISFAISDKIHLGTEPRKKGLFGLAIGHIRTFFSIENQVFKNDVDDYKYCKTLSVPFTFVCRYNKLPHWNGNNGFRLDSVFRATVMMEIVNSIRWTSPINTDYANLYPVSVHLWENDTEDSKMYTKDILTEVIDEIQIVGDTTKTLKEEYRKTDRTLKDRWRLATHVAVHMIPSGEKKGPLKG
jgi:hypothetical protein